MRLQKLLILLLFICLISEAHSQILVINEKVVVAGFVFDSETEEALPYVNVYVKKTRKGTITDTTGFFVLFARTGDTLVFSSIAHHKLHFEVNDSIGDIKDPGIVFLKPRIYELMSVDIIALKRYQQFKYDFERLELPDDAYVYAYQNFPELPSELAYYSRQGTEGFGLVMHPISALYDIFSKEGRQKRKLAELQEQDIIYEKVHYRFSPQIISRITGTSIDEAEKFINWCDFSNMLIISLTDYELIELIVRQYEKYKKKKE